MNQNHTYLIQNIFSLNSKNVLKTITAAHMDSVASAMSAMV